ncbi:rod-binding protein [Vibrio furnissii]|uniref:rod-binding protein n=1 Tax=Vibrio furnissii TaxID=29494 RepID=UPI0024BBE17F|nr:rod-binding protein [Vibrio furnissii]WHR51687.1 rod-binding protein [Vibrio furnissii]
MFADFLRIFGIESAAKPELTDAPVRSNPIQWVAEQCYVPLHSDSLALTPSTAAPNASAAHRPAPSDTFASSTSASNTPASNVTPETGTTADMAWQQLAAFDDVAAVASRLEGQSVAGQNNAFYLDPQALASIKYDADQDAALREVSRQFEALFVQELFKRMRSATEALGDEENPLSNNSNSMFQSMLDNQLAMSVTQQRSFGLAEMLYQQLSGQHMRNA